MGIATARNIFRSTLTRNAVIQLATKSRTPPAATRSLPSARLAHRILRRPVELSAMLDSMQPYHTATSASLMISNLIVSRCGYGWLVEDIAVMVDINKFKSSSGQWSASCNELSY